LRCSYFFFTNFFFFVFFMGSLPSFAFYPLGSLNFSFFPLWPFPFSSSVLHKQFGFTFKLNIFFPFSSKFPSVLSSFPYPGFHLPRQVPVALYFFFFCRTPSTLFLPPFLHRCIPTPFLNLCSPLPVFRVFGVQFDPFPWRLALQ